MSRSVSTLNQNHVANWTRLYRKAPKGYKPHTLTSVLKADGPKMLAAVLASLGLEDSNALVRDWESDERPTDSPRPNAPASREAGKGKDLYIDSLGEAGEEGERD